MEHLFQEYLSDLITLKNIKIVDRSNKKLISSCIFIPENPEITMKTPNYFTGLIKSIETFSNRIEPEWIYRLYVDDMFLSAIESKEAEPINEDHIPGDDSSYSKYKYAHNNMTSNSNKSESNNSNNTKKIKREKRIIKENIKLNSKNLKKILTLIHIYLKNIMTSTEKKYRNIEIVSFRCDMASVSSKYPGHSSTFGSIMRFCPMFDSTVDMFVSVNSRYALNPLLTEIITSWANNDVKRMLTYTYETEFMYDCFLDSIHRPLLRMRDSKKERGLNVNDTDNNVLVNVLNDIYKMKQTIFDEPEELTVDLSPKRSFRDKKPILPEGLTTSGSGTEHEKKYLNTLENNISIGAGLFGMKQDIALFKTRITIFCKLLRYFIITKNKFNFGIDELFLKLVLAFEAGTHDIDSKNYIKYRNIGHSKMIKMTKEQVKKWCKDNDISFKKLGEIDGIELSAMTFNKLNVLGFKYSSIGGILNKIHRIGSIKADYIMNLMATNNKYYFPNRLTDTDTSYISNSQGEPLILKTDFFESETGRRIHDSEFIDNYLIDYKLGLNLFNISTYESRSLLQTKSKVQLKESDIINYKYTTEGVDGIEHISTTISHLFSSFDEYKKLYLIDSLDTNRLTELMLNVKDIKKYYTIVDLNDYPLYNMDILLKLLIDYYNKDFIQYTPLKVDTLTYELSNSNDENSNLNKANSNDENGNGINIRHSDTKTPLQNTPLLLQQKKEDNKLIHQHRTLHLQNFLGNLELNNNLSTTNKKTKNKLINKIKTLLNKKNNRHYRQTLKRFYKHLKSRRMTDANITHLKKNAQKKVAGQMPVNMYGMSNTTKLN